MTVRRLDAVQPATFAFSAENLAWAKSTIAKYPQGKQASAVIPLLWRAQEQNAGWLSRPAMEYVGRMLEMAFIRVYEVATFYTMFQLSPVGRKAHVQVCGTTPCMLRGAEDLKKVCQRRIHKEPHHLSANGDFSWEEVECLGACVNAPMVQIWKDTYEDLTPESLDKLLDGFAAGHPPKPGPQNGRQLSAPQGALTSLTDSALYSGQRVFTRVEPPPSPAPPAPGAPAAGSATVPPSEAAKPKTVAPETAPTIKPPPAAKSEGSSGAAPAADTMPKVIKQADAPAKAAAKPPAKAKAGASTETPARRKTTAAKPTGMAEPAVRPREAGAPILLMNARGGGPDDLKLIWGVGPKLEKMLHGMGVYHFDQIATWTEEELAWVDQRLEGFKGRAARDKWVSQSEKLATGWRPTKGIGDKPT